MAYIHNNLYSALRRLDSTEYMSNQRASLKLVKIPNDDMILQTAVLFPLSLCLKLNFENENRNVDARNDAMQHLDTSPHTPLPSIFVTVT